MTRDEKLARYRHLREINTAQQTAALSRVAGGTILDYGRRLGMVRGGMVVCDSASEMALIFDLAVYAGKAGRSRGIERYARSVEKTLTGDAAMILRAEQVPNFRVWRIERRHESVGLWVVDIMQDETMWLIDEGLEASARPGLLFAGRLMAVDDFVMTCGVSVPLSVTLLAAAVENTRHVGSPSREALLNDPRFAILIYRSAIETGTMETIQFADPDAPALEMETVD